MRTNCSLIEGILFEMEKRFLLFVSQNNDFICNIKSSHLLDLVHNKDRNKLYVIIVHMYNSTVEPSITID